MHVRQIEKLGYHVHPVNIYVFISLSNLHYKSNLRPFKRSTCLLTQCFVSDLFGEYGNRAEGDATGYFDLYRSTFSC